MNKPNAFDALANKSQPVKKAKRKHKKVKYWPEDFVGQRKTLSDMIDAKLAQWHDDEYDAGKDW